MSTPVFEKDLTGLLVVDPYNDFISEGGILWPLVREIAEAVHCVPNMLAIFQAARSAGVRVFFAPHHRDRGREDEIEGWKYIAPIQNFGHECLLGNLSLGSCRSQQPNSREVGGPFCRLDCTCSKSASRVHRRMVPFATPCPLALWRSLF
jgi:Isochorismatase family